MSKDASTIISFAAFLFLILSRGTYGGTNSRILLSDGDTGFEYQATTDVSFLLNLALDVGEMRKSGNDLQAAKDIYYNGKNAFYTDQDGQRVVISLAGLSLASGGVMSGDLLYNVYRDAFYDLGIENENDSAGNFDGHPVEHYADTLVQDLFELNSTRTETEGAIVLNVWMAVAHEMYTVLQSCSSNNVDGMNGALDRATALWIGADQARGDNQEGHMMYNLAEIAGELFGQDDGETRVNNELMKLINSIQRNIKAGTCAQQGGYLNMRQNILNATSLMTIPLVQILVHHIENVQNEGQSDMVELYALSLLPRVASCDPAKFKTMLQWMVFNSLTVDNQESALEMLQSVYSCFDVTCADVGSYLGGRVPECSDAIDSQTGPPALAGYTPSTDVRSKSYIDRDLLQMRLLLEWEAYDAAKDYYKYGFNSQYSLADLATNQAGLDTNEEYSKFQTYYNSTGERSANDIILSVLDGLKPFDSNASDDQKVDVVMTVLQSVVMYLASLGELEAAVAKCEAIAAGSSAASQQNVLELWDGGAAYYIGSIEGTATGGRASDGQLLYGIAKTLCSKFGTCQPDDASVNKVVVQSLGFGKTALQNSNCAEAKSVLQDTIKPSFYVPLIQGTLYYASKSGDLVTGVDSTDFASLFGYSLSLLPHLSDVYPQSATLLRQNSAFQLTTTPMPQGFDAIFRSFKDALNHMATDCKTIGSLPPYGGLCVDIVPTSSPNTPSSFIVANLAFGEYKFSSQDVAAQDSLLSLDVRDMRQTGNIQTAQSIYVDGRNAKQGLYGQVNIKSLSDISSQAHLYMSEDPIFNYFRYALYDESTFESLNNNTSWPFADMVVRLALSPDHGNDANLAAESAVVMNVFFLIQHRLYRAGRECKQGTNPSHLIDSAVSLWIGRDQQEGKFNSGWMLYSLAQQTAQQYGQPEGEAAINTELMDMFNQAQVLADFCSSQPGTFEEIRVLSRQIIQKFSRVIVQRLLYFMSEDNLDYTELYGLSIIPQAVSCDANVYQNLKSALIDSFSRDTTIDDNLYEQIGSLLKCLRMTCDDLGDTTRASSHLQDIVSNLCTKLREDETTKELAGYIATYDISEESRIDLDIRQIGIFMKTRAYEAAADYYMYGANSLKTPRSFLSMQYLATTPDRSNIGAEFTRYSAYFGNDDNYADSIITAALKQAGDYQNASRLQLNEIVVRTLQTMVSYMAVLWMLNSAVDACENGQASQEFLDTAVAYFVGSLEGKNKAGILNGYGELLFSLGKEQCLRFDSCDSSGNANINQRIMSDISSMKFSLSSNNCTAAATMYNEIAKSLVPVAMVQGTLYYASANEELEPRSTSKTVAAGAILADSVLPMIDAANPSSARTIYNNMAFHLDQVPVSNGTYAVFNAFARAINQTGINCTDVGVLRPVSRGICTVQDDSSRPGPNTPTSLGNDLYVSSTFVQNVANIAIDVKEMEDALIDERKDFARLIYNNGKNSDIYDQNGTITGHRSLASFSLQATSDMNEEPLFNLYVYALQDDSGLFMGEDAKHYADTIVKDSFNVKDLEAKTLPAEAAVALNVWMYLAHMLYQTLDDCKNGNLVGEDGIHSIDEAAAYWIGDGQIAGSAQRGHLLYALAEEMGENFQMGVNGQARTNTNILKYFHQAKMELSLPDACANNTASFKSIYGIVNKITSEMAVPLIQGLIHYLRQNDAPRVKVYAYAVVPLISACSPATFTYLKNKLIYSSFNVVEVEPIIDRIMEILPCLGLQCDDLGVHKSEIEPSCTDPPVLRSLAGYKPASNVLEFAQIDLDILEIDILMRMGAYRAAEDLYTNGKHTVSPDSNNQGLTTSLSSLATTTARSVVPEFDSFVRYFGGDQDYADSIIRDALSNNKYDLETRRLLVVRNCQYMIMFMTALQNMHEAIGNCEANETVQDAATAESWDKAAASIIGFLEGTENGGSNEGELFFALAKKYCDGFGTCSSSSSTNGVSAANNDRIVSILYSGRGAVSSRSCSKLKEATTQLKPLLLVPIIQATLSSSMNLVNGGIRQKALAAGQVEAHIFATIVLPLIEDVDRNAAQTIETNLALTSTPFQDGVQAVFSAFASVYGGLGVNCHLLGSMEGMDACSGSVKMNTKTITGISVGGVVFLLSVCGIVCLVRTKRHKRKKGAPIFIEPAGEMSYTDDLLVKSENEVDRYGPGGVNEHGDYPEEVALKSAMEKEIV